MELSQFRKTKYGDTQKAEGTTYIGAITGARGDELKKAHERARANAEARKKAAEDPGVTERVAKTATGAAKSAGASFTNTGGTILEALAKLNTRVQTGLDAGAIQAARDNAARYQAQLKTAKTQAERDRLSMLIRRNQAVAGMKQELRDSQEARTQAVANQVYQKADALDASADKDIQRAKQGAGAVGQFAVDLGVAGTQMLGDVAASAVLPGSGLALMGARSFGSGAQEARQSGASFGQQVAYGAGSAALGVATEKIANVAGPFKKAFGSGVLDKAIAGATGKMGSTAAGKAALSALSEGGEEVVESLLQPILQRATYDPEALAHYNDPDYWTGVLYDGLVGGTLGLVGSGMENVGTRLAAQKAAGSGAETRAQREQGSFIPGVQSGAESVLDAKKAAPGVGTAFNENGLSALTEQEKVNLSSGKRNKVISTFQDAVDFVKSAIANKQSVNRAYLGKVPDTVAQTVKHNTGLDISGFGVMINENDVRHILKDHGDALAEAAMGQVAVTPEDIAGIPEVLSSPDRVYLSNELDSKGRKALVFEKQIGDRFITIQGVSDGKHALQTDTLYIRKGRTRTTRDTMHSTEGAAPVINAQSVPPQSSSSIDSTIARSAESVKKDVLSDILTGRKRVAQTGLSNEQFASLADRGDIDMDASGKVYRVNPAEHIDNRTVDSVGSRGVNAFQFDHPQLHEYYKQAAEALIADADLSLQFPMSRSYERTVQGNKVNQSAEVSAHLRKAMDETGLSRNDIIDAAKRIVHDQGQENVKAAKQVEVILDQMLSNGWTTMTGEQVGANQGYLDTKNAIAGSGPSAQTGEELPIWDMEAPANDGLGAADRGSLNSDYERLQAQSETFHPEGANAARPVDVPTTNFDGRNIPKSTSTIMGAQGVPDSDVRSIEQQIADGKLAFDTITDADSVGRAQTAIAEKGFDGALEQYRQAAGSGIVTKDNTTLGQQLLLQAMRSGDTASTAELLALYTRNSTTAAQAMQAQSIFRKLSPEGQLLAVKKAVDDLNAKYETDVQLSPEEIAEFLNAKNDSARKSVADSIMDRAAKSVPGTFKAKYDTLRYLAMLGNPRTHIRNILGNTFFQVPVAVKNRVGAVAETVANKVTGGKVERTKSLFGVNPLGKLATECRADWENAKDFLGQSQKYMEGQTSLWNIEQRADAFSDANIIGRGVNKLADLNSTALEAEDTAAKKFIYTQSLAGYLQANGCKSLSDASLALLNRARNYAAQEALRNTFNDKNAVSDAVSKLGSLSKSDNKAVKAAGYVVEGVLPFKRAPANIAVRAVEYSPVGAVLGAVETVRGAAAGDMARVSTGLDRVASGVTGTALLAAGFLAAGAGYVTGGEDEDEKQKGFDDLTGHQNYALELKDGTSITLDWLSPEAIPFFMGVELYNAALDGGQNWSDMLDAVKNASAPMLEMSMLQGLNDTFENAASAQNRGESVMGALVVSALTNYATQIFPTIGGQLERSSEGQRMTTYTDKSSQIPTDLQYTLGKVSQKIPGWDFQQIPYIDAWGRTEESGDVLVRSINNLFNPAYVSQVDVDKVEKELQRIKDATGDTSVFPQRAAKYFNVNGERKDLTAEEYVKYAKALGNMRYQLAQQAMQTKAYREMDDAGKADFISKMYELASAKAAKQVAGGYQYSDEMQRYMDAEKEGITPVEFYAYKEATGGLKADKDANGKSITGSKKEKVISAIDAQNLSPTEKDWLYLLSYDGNSAQKDLRKAPWNK